jgi:hypothetical protein
LDQWQLSGQWVVSRWAVCKSNNQSKANPFPSEQIKPVKKWVFTFRVKPPANQVVSVRFGSSVCFAAYSPFLDQWYLIANGSEEKIDEPQMIFLEESYVAEHQRTDFVARPQVQRSRKKKDVQLLLF